MSYYDQLTMFLDQCLTDDLRTAKYNSSYLGLKVKVSFGIGNQANIPWISFLREGQTTANGVYPVYLYYKNEGLLILAYGISETNAPKFDWDSSLGPSIKSFFAEKNIGRPFRYGKSMVYRAYEGSKLPKRDEIDRDLEKIIDEYKSLSFDDQNRNMEEFDWQDFRIKIETSGLTFNELTINRFVAALLTKPFVILTGLSGSGKTKLALSFAQWICQSTDQYNLVPVGADWTNREQLLGFPNALDNNKYVRPESGVLDLLLHAKDNPALPHFLILDEMNLSHVERYFADFLSVIESGEAISLHSNEDEIDGVPPNLKIPDNLFVIGTVNIDETTYMFSPKVLDRANTIEFRVSQTEIASFLENHKHLDDIENSGASMAADFLNLSRADADLREDSEMVSEVLVEFFVELEKLGAEFGYRTAYEIQNLIAKLGDLDSKLSLDDKIDAAVIQKLLPKLHGSRRKLEPVLLKLGHLCITPESEVSDADIFDPEKIVLNDAAIVRFPLSFEKIRRMHRNAVDNGFASFAEA